MELELPQDFRELFEFLNANRVEYLLLGGYAVIAYGYVRNTSDIDVVVNDSLENSRRLMKALAEFGFAETQLQPELFAEPDSVVRMGVEPMRIEILNYLKGVDFNEAYSRRRSVKVEDVSVDLIGLSDLLANKKAVGRPKDLVDVEELERRS
jgi:predicted nucleotidyltransferase